MRSTEEPVGSCLAPSGALKTNIALPVAGRPSEGPETLGDGAATKARVAGGR